jgi:hypothetical protein
MFVSYISTKIGRNLVTLQEMIQRRDFVQTDCEESTTVGALGMVAEILFASLGLRVGQKD